MSFKSVSLRSVKRHWINIEGFLTSLKDLMPVIVLAIEAEPKALPEEEQML